MRAPYPNCRGSVTFRVDDNAGKYAQTSKYFTVNTPGGDNEPPGVVTIAEDEVLYRISINAGATKYYKFTIPQSGSGSSHGMQVTMGTWDWTTNQDMMFSLGLPYPTTSDYPVATSFNADGDVINGSKKWANISPGSSNETVKIYSDLAAGTYYVMIHNTSNVSGSFGFRFGAW